MRDPLGNDVSPVWAWLAVLALAALAAACTYYVGGAAFVIWSAA